MFVFYLRYRSYEFSTIDLNEEDQILYTLCSMDSNVLFLSVSPFQSNELALGFPYQCVQILQVRRGLSSRHYCSIHAHTAVRQLCHVVGKTQSCDWSSEFLLRMIADLVRSSSYSLPQFSASIPGIVYALLGSSRQLNVAPEAALSLLLGQAVSEIRHDYPEVDAEYLGLTVASVITVQVRKLLYFARNAVN